MSVVEFLKNIKKNDEVVIVFHNDADGMCACALLNKFLESIGKDSLIISQPMPTDKNLFRKIQTTIPTKIIFLDLAVDQQSNVITKLSNIANILIIDHHQISRNMNSSRIVHYNPRFKNPKIYQSASYLVYKILSELFNAEEFLWIAATGIIGDYNIEDSEDLVEEIKKRYSIEDLYDSLFAKIADMISAAKATKALTSEEIANLVGKVKDPKDLVGVEKFIESFQLVEKEISEVMLDAENSEKIGDIIFYNLKSHYNIRSEIAKRLSEKNPSKLVLVYQKIGSKLNASARSKNIDIARIFKRISRNIKASVGGHEQAAGATLNIKDWETFKENLVEALK
ncbi:MAG: DHH family phosphoesterase [Candidatus Aenigmatarchaeota archaeon]